MYHIISHARRHYTENNHSCWNCSCLNTPNKPHLSQNLLFNHGLSAYYSALEQTALISFPVMNWEFYMEVEKNKDPNVMVSNGSRHPRPMPRAPVQPQRGQGREHTQLNVIYHILAPWWPMRKELANPHIAPILKSTHIFIPASHNLGGRAKTTTQPFCVVPVGTAVKTWDFFSGSWTKKDLICCIKEQHSPGRRRIKLFCIPQASSHFLSHSPS